jgi:hypothetical protein
MPCEASSGVVAESVCTALEAMAFVCPLPWEAPEPPAAADPLLRLTVRINDGSGLEIFTTDAFALYLASSSLGVATDDPAATERARDALRELGNITCGTYLRRICGSGTPPSMGIPVVEELPAAQWPDASDPDTMLLDADGHALAVRLRRAA